MEVYIGPTIVGIGIVILIAVLFMRKKKKTEKKEKQLTRQQHIDKMQNMKSH